MLVVHALLHGAVWAAFQCFGSPQIRTPDFVALRELLLKKPSKFLLDVLQNGILSLRDRVKLAYELSLTMFLVLEKDWFCLLCSCCIQRFTENSSYDEEFEYSLQINYVQHLNLVTGAYDREDRQWCEEKLRKMHIRRFGIILLELALSKPIMHAAFFPEQTRVGIDIDLNDLKGKSDADTYDPREASERARLASTNMGDEIAEIVYYCLRQPHTPSEIKEEQLHRFYLAVVEP